MRAFYIIIALILYASSVDLYIWYFTNSTIDVAYLKAWYGLSTLFALGCYKIDSKNGDVSWFQVNFRDILFYSVLINISITLLTHVGIINKDDYRTKFYILNGSIVALSILIIIVGVRHGAFKKTSILSNA